MLTISSGPSKHLPRPAPPAPFFLLFALAAGAAACAPSGRGDPAPAADPSPSLSPPPPPATAEAKVRAVASRADVPLRGPRVDAKKGDWLLEGPGGVAVVSAAKGTVVDFGAEGGDDALVSLDPALFVGLDQAPEVVEAVAPAGEGSRAVLIRKRLLTEPPLRLWTYVTFAGGALRLESVAAAGSQAAPAVTLGEVVAWGNVPTWIEGHGFVDRQETLSGDFIAREGLGVAYALATERGHVTARLGAPEPGFHEWARTGEVVESIPAGGSSSRRVVTVAVAAGALGQAVAALPRFRAAARDRPTLPKGLAADVGVEVAGCDGAPYARFDGTAPEVALPPGCWRARLVAPGHAPGAWLAPGELASARPDVAWPRAGTLHWAIRERRGSEAVVVPARLLVRGVDGTPDPDWGEEPSDGASLDVLHVDRDGERAIPPGHYRVTVSRGFEYTQREVPLEVKAGKTTVLETSLERVVDTRGWIAADLHVHAVPSPDAPTPLADRVRTLVAAGVEVAVATDHNAVTDYAPAIRERGLGPWLASIVGDEVTTRGVLFGHFNVFPLAPDAAAIAFDRVTPAQIVAASRAAAPGGAASVVQLNHPRMGSIGYFELARFDPRDVAAWRARSPLAETAFDAIEVYNGDDYAHRDHVERAMRDWFALLDGGVHLTATGNSDSHKATYHECGVPRNLVEVGDDDPSRFDEARFVAAVRAGRVVVSGGPAVWLDLAGKGIGETVAAGEIAAHVVVDAPPWIDVSQVDLVGRGGRVLQSWTGPFGHGVRRLDARVTLSLKHGDWVIAVAKGERPMTFLARPGARPLSFTNPVWID